MVFNLIIGSKTLLTFNCVYRTIKEMLTGIRSPAVMSKYRAAGFKAKVIIDKRKHCDFTTFLPAALIESKRN